MENFLKKNKRGTLIRDPPESMREYTIIMLNMVEYACIYLNRQSSEYARILHVFDTVHSVRPLSKLLSSYWDRGVFRTLSNIEMKPFARRIMTKNNQTHNQKFLKAGEVSWNFILNGKLNPKMDTVRSSFSKITALFVFSIKGRVDQSQCQSGWICINIPEYP